MTREEYKKELEMLQNEYKAKLTELCKRYAFENRKCDVGDIIEDHIGRILVQELKFSGVPYQFEYYPHYYYAGIELRKSDNQPKKNGAIRTISNYNIKRIISKKE